MKITREESTEWNYPCFGRAEDGDVVWFTSEEQGHRVSGCSYVVDGWIMDCFTPIDNPFEDKKVEKFKPITIVLETETEAEAMYDAMSETPAIELTDWNKLITLIG
jgi:hypothetical protein